MIKNKQYNPAENINYYIIAYPSAEISLDNWENTLENNDEYIPVDAYVSVIF